MYHARLKKAYEDLGISRKQFAEKAQLSEKTIKRILDNPDYKADLDTMVQISKALNITMLELFSETDVVLIRKEDLAELEAAKQFVEECKTLSVDNIELREKVCDLEKKNKVLQTNLAQKEEIIAIHESYKSLLSGLAQIVTDRSTDTQ